MEDVFVVLLEVLGRRMDGSAGEDLDVVRGDRLARAPSRSAALAGRHLGRRIRRLRRVVGGSWRMDALKGLGQWLGFRSVGQHAVFVVEAGGRRGDGGRRARHGADFDVFLGLDGDVGQRGRRRSGRGVSDGHG